MTDVAAGAMPVDPGSTAWMLMSSALVLLMVPGLALFYGGLVRRKNVLTTCSTVSRRWRLSAYVVFVVL